MGCKARKMERLGHSFRRCWPLLIAGVIVVLALATGRLLAAPSTQTGGTVPPPTIRPPATSTPRATPTPNRDRGGNQSSPAATATNQATVASPPGAQATAAARLTAVVTANRLNVRSGAGVNFGVVGVVLAGETLTILDANANNGWWHICCATGTTTEGWVSGQFIHLTTPPAGVTTAASSTGTATGAPPLSLMITQSPRFAWQGQEIALVFTITNQGDTTASNVELRNELPVGLSYLQVEAPATATLSEEREEGERLAFVVIWSQLAAGAVETVTVRVRVEESLPDGGVIDNLAVLGATGVEPYTAGVTIGMPPVMPPTFQ
jgi:uncharacterized repeat protein (TIGR01451 family)